MLNIKSEILKLIALTTHVNYEQNLSHLFAQR